MIVLDSSCPYFRWFGLRCFLVLSIATGNELSSESKCNLLTSSATIALRNTSCDIPFFVQIQENWRRLFAGEMSVVTKWTVKLREACTNAHFYFRKLVLFDKINDNKISLVSNYE